jgi:hypothetical protein
VAVRVLLNDDLELRVDLEWDEMLKLFSKALASNQALRVENGDGKVRAINPHQILLMEPLEESEQIEDFEPKAVEAEQVSA